MKYIRDILRLIFCVFLCQLAGVVGSLFTVSAVPTWYAALAKPSFIPPNWLFGPAWITLYTFMGIALFIVWERRRDSLLFRLALAVFATQLILNAWWSVIFFGLQSPFWALVEIVFLWLAILSSLVLFWRISPWAGLLLVPYLFWTSLAAWLNFAVWRLN